MRIQPQIQQLALAMAALVLTGCSETPEPVPPVTQVSVLTVTPADIELTEDLPGRVAPLRIAEIRPQVSGIVQRRIFEQGSEVRAGQALFQINPAPFKAEVDTAAAALQRAEATRARTALQAKRLEPLVAAQAVSRQTYDDAASQHNEASADVAQARATLERRLLDIKFAAVDSPISGRIDQALVTEGALVGPADTQPMARVQQIDQVYVDVRQPASALENWQAVLAAATTPHRQGVPATILRNNGEPHPIPGRILFSGVNVDAGTGDVLLRIQVDNPQRLLLPGMFVRARVPRASHTGALMVPQQSVLRSGAQARVWIVDAQNQASTVPVTLGELSHRQYRIASGLSAGQIVVVEGMDRLTQGAQVSTRPWQLAAAVTAPASPTDVPVR